MSQDGIPDDDLALLAAAITRNEDRIDELEAALREINEVLGRWTDDRNTAAVRWIIVKALAE